MWFVEDSKVLTEYTRKNSFVFYSIRNELSTNNFGHFDRLCQENGSPQTTQKAFKQGKLTFLPSNVNFPRLQ